VGVSNRAYSLLTVKAVEDGDQRIIEGIATDISADRVGDVVEPKGATFKLPLPLLWQHRHDQPIGHVTHATVTDSGIKIKAQIASGVLPRIDEAWALIKSGLVRGLSIGFRSLEDPEPIKGTWGVRFQKWEWLELSAVTIPANAEATIHAVKSLDTAERAAIGTSAPVTSHRSGDTGATRVVSITPQKVNPMKTYQEQIAALEATRATKAAELDAIQTKASSENRTKDEAEREVFTTLKDEIKGIDDELADLREMEKLNVQKAVPAAATTTATASQARAGVVPSVTFNEQVPAGIGFARAVKASVVAKLDGRNALDVAKDMYPSDTRLHAHLTHSLQMRNVVAQMKANVNAGTTVDTAWAGVLVDPTNLAGEFIEYLRPATIIGKFGTGNIPSLRRVPFNVRMIEQTQGGTGYWVGQGAPKPLTAFAFGAVTLAQAKVAAISVITDDLARWSSPSAETLVRDGLRDALVERIDQDFIDPASAGSTNVQPASITNGLSALSSAGTSADNARTDLAAIMADFVEANQDPSGVVLIMPTTLALSLSFLVNSLGQPEFPGLSMSGGNINGIPVITSQYATDVSGGGGNLVIAVNAREIFLADDGQVTVDASREASLQMLDNPTNNSATATATAMVSMWQTNSIALRAERFINWSKRRSTAVVYMDDVNWGSVGSPA
jgi:HK97 family phage major capsid protein/HK97 family phage prohead protease